MQSGVRGGEGGGGRGFMEDKGAAASGVEVTGEGGKRTRGGENTESTCHWESQKSGGNQKCCQKQHQQLIFAFSVVTLLGCGLKQFLLFSTPPALSSSVLES